MTRKPSIGRQKIEIAKITKKNHLQVTFSKRRPGLFKKASELCTLCGAEVAIVVFSPAGKVHSFGHPTVDTLADRFLNARAQMQDLRKGEERRHLEDQLHAQLAHMQAQIQGEKKRRGGTGQAPGIDEMGLPELEAFQARLEELKLRVMGEANNRFLEESNISISSSDVPSFHECKPLEQQLDAAALDFSRLHGLPDYFLAHGPF